MLPLTLRLAGPADEPALKRLAQLDSRPLPPGPHLLAERQDRVDAALSLDTGELIADPFRHTAEIGELLRHHARGLRIGAQTAAPGRFDVRPATATA